MYLFVKGKAMMVVLGVLAQSTTDSGMRIVLLSLLLVAVLLLCTGCTIAVLTFLRQRKATFMPANAERLESERT